MSRRIFTAVLLILLAGLVASCGSKGALVMPDQQTSSKKKQPKFKSLPPPVPAQPTPAQAPAQPAPAQPASDQPAAGQPAPAGDSGHPR